MCVTELSVYIQFTEGELQLRTRTTHASHVADLDGPLHSHIATTYGVTKASALNDLRYFHVVNGLVPDIMHDVLEGTTQLSLKHLLLYLINEKKFFTLNKLNDRIVSFQYGPGEVSNRPSTISMVTFKAEKNTLKQSGMWI